MKKKIAVIIMLALICALMPAFVQPAQAAVVKLGNEVLMEKYHNLIENKRVGLVTNQTGVNSQGQSTIDVLAADSKTHLVALYGPEHGIDGKTLAGKTVNSYTHPTLKIPVYSLYGATRMPTPAMLAGIDVLVFDVQDIGARSYTFMSTLNYCMVAAKKAGKQVVVLDRPNPVGGINVDGPVMEDKFISFVGVDNLPMAHGMTAGELAQFFNRKIGADLVVVPMEGYTRSMIFQDTGLPWVPTSPMIPDMASMFGYMATGLGENTGIGQQDKFKWIGGKGLNSQAYAALMNQAGLPGVQFSAENRGSAGGARLNITDYHTFNPARTGIYALANAYKLTHFKVPKSGKTINMFDKIMGTDKIGQYLEAGLSAAEIESRYAESLNQFKSLRSQYLIYKDAAPVSDNTDSKPVVDNTVYNPVPDNTDNQPAVPAPSDGAIQVIVNSQPISFEVQPEMDQAGRVLVPMRGIIEALGATVDWDGTQGKITVTKGNDSSSIFMIGMPAAIIRGQTMTLDVSPRIKNGRTLVPVRYVAESVGAAVNWDAAARKVVITAQ